MADTGKARTVRTVTAVVLAVLLGAVTYYVLLFFGSAGQRLGWLWAALGYLPALLLAALVWGGPSWAVRGLVVAGAAVIAGLVTWRLAPPTHEYLQHVAAEIDLPGGWAVVDRHDYGDDWCLEGCPRVAVDYAAGDATAYDDARDELVAAMTADGWEVAEEGIGPEDGVRLENGRWTAVLDQPFAEPGADVTLELTG